MSSVQPSDGSPSTSSNRWTVRFKATVKVVVDHAVKHTGVGIVCAVAYFDPGNWGVDLQAGSQFGYKLLFVVLLSGLFAVFLQSLASKLGIVTGLDLASHCRLLLYNRPKHTRLIRWLALYPLYALSEIAIMSTDLAELLGSAIALNLLFPKLPLWAGVLLTACDVLLILALEDPLGGRPVKMFELIIAALVIAVLICMCIIISRVSVDWGDAFDGFVPSKTIFEHGGLYTSVGILGATVMPHSLFLGSALATQDRVSPRTSKPLAQSSDSVDSLSTASISRWHPTPRDWWRSFVSNFRVAPLDPAAEPKCHAERENNSLSFVKSHLGHGIADIVISLLGFAVLINSLILILASAVFYYGQDREDSSHATASLFDAHDLIQSVVGRGAAITFCPRPSLCGAKLFDNSHRCGSNRLGGLSPLEDSWKAGIDTMLVASQVVLSIVLPFIVFPLVWLTSSKSIMRVRKPRPEEEIQVQVKDDDATSAASTPGQSSVDIRREDADLEQAEDEMVDFSNGRIVAAVGYAIWLLVVIANGYVLISLMLGEGS
ncbi:hypothetical protein EVG20_g1959 [Dentipellis fragilis]|uniref:Amino acid transporter transmembrane domain-containing protein n=1 Tax=Dentipellis fragilis TaxID=205917 RepID=A0A4Y9ZB34_9AGAM|nr:hypothetical protein EVG20_g1959 [Dentipellis fragilis]